MKYDREWLDSIHQTEHLISNAPINEVPFPHRPIIQRQFNAQITAFKHELANALDTSTSQRHLLDLTFLACQLINEAEKRAASFAAHPSNGQ
jgi:hypothetical protein